MPDKGETDSKDHVGSQCRIRAPSILQLLALSTQGESFQMPTGDRGILAVPYVTALALAEDPVHSIDHEDVRTYFATPLTNRGMAG